MKIAASDVSLASTHFESQQHSVTESMRAWVGDKRPDFEGMAGQGAATAPDLVQISDAGKAQAAQAAQAASQTAEVSEDETESDPKMQLIKGLLEYLTGEKITLFHANEIKSSNEAKTPTEVKSPDEIKSRNSNPPPPRAGYGIEYDRQESYSENEQSSFRASGVIRTADNKEIKFDISLEMQRSFQQTSNLSIRQGDAAKKIDPLVINFSGKAAELTEQRFDFDLNADGKTENIQFVRGSGFLALDRNDDGVINNGSELFGPTTGNGFSELAVLDDDKNGWIDESDAAYDQLKIWTKDNAGNDQIQDLKQANVGAVMVDSIATPFQIKDAQNKLQAQVRSAGVWLSEQGTAGTVQQIDLVA